jgi:hypothetical protein
VIPTYEEAGSRDASKAEAIEEQLADENIPASEIQEPAEFKPVGAVTQKSTRHLIERAIQRLVRAGGRKSEADGAHLLEGIAVVAYDPGTGKMDANLPPPGSGLRWDEFVDALSSAYEARFEG